MLGIQAPRGILRHFGGRSADRSRRPPRVDDTPSDKRDDLRTICTRVDRQENGVGDSGLGVLAACV